MKLTLIILLILTLFGPIWILLNGEIDFSLHYQTADRSSTHLAPDGNKTSDAIIQVYAARAFNWRGIFSVHTWIAVKPKNSREYKTYQVIGWRTLRGLSPIAIQNDIPDRKWFGQKPAVILKLRGNDAEKLIPQIEEAAKNYPYPNTYETWPGPNSNTFTAFIARQVPELKLAMPPNAIGKDFLPNTTFFARAPSGTGYQFSFYGLFGLLIARDEGLEINLLSLVYGINPKMLSIKLPGVGDIKIY